VLFECVKHRDEVKDVLLLANSKELHDLQEVEDLLDKEQGEMWKCKCLSFNK